MINKFEDWLKEDFAAVGAAPDGNVIGMGDVSAPTSTLIGSGDAWPSLGEPYSLLKTRRKKRKKRKKKLDENRSEISFHNDIKRIEKASVYGEDADPYSVFGLLAAANDINNVDPMEWGQMFDDYYESALMVTHSVREMVNLRNSFATGDHMWYFISTECEDGTEENPVLKDDYELKFLTSNGWKIFSQDFYDQGTDDSWLHVMFRKDMSDKNKIDRSASLLKLLKSNKVNGEEFKIMTKFLVPKDAHELRGAISGHEYGI